MAPVKNQDAFVEMNGQVPWMNTNRWAPEKPGLSVKKQLKNTISKAIYRAPITPFITIKGPFCWLVRTGREP